VSECVRGWGTTLGLHNPCLMDHETGTGCVTVTASSGVGIALGVAMERLLG
jgi:hypothetical protein